MADALNTVAPKIPYGRADFRGIRLDGSPCGQGALRAPVGSWLG